MRKRRSADTNMRLAKVVTIASLLVACTESERISSCGYACHQASAKMISYSNENGCKCDTPIRCLDADGGAK